MSEIWEAMPPTTTSFFLPSESSVDADVEEAVVVCEGEELLLRRIG